MRAAVDLIRETETLDLHVTDVIAAAGVSNRAFYRHFSGKTELLMAVLEDGNRQYMEHLERRMAACDTPLGAVETWIRGMLARAQNPSQVTDTRPFILNGMRLAYEFPEESLAADEVLRRPLRDALALAREDGTAPGIDVERATSNVVQLTLGQMTWSLIQRDPLREDEVADVVAFALAGVRRAGA